MPAIWPDMLQRDGKEPRDIARRLAIVGAVTVLSGAMAAFAVSLVPPVHRARIELSTDGAPLPSWTRAEIQDIVKREASGEGGGDASSLSALLQKGSTPLEGSASRRAGIMTLSNSRSVVWADAGNAALAERRVRLVVDELLARAPKPARRLASVEDLPEAQTARDEASARGQALAEAQRRLADAETRLAEFRQAEAQAAASRTNSGGDASARAALEQRQAEIDAAISAVETARVDQELPDVWQSWDAWRRLITERRALEAKAGELEGQLGEANPRLRIVRLRLQQLAADIAQRRDELLSWLREQRSANEAAIRAITPAASQTASAEAEAATREALTADLASARAALDALQTAGAPASPEANASSAPDHETAASPAIVQTSLPPTQRSLSLWPGALAGSVAGFLGSSFFLAMSWSLRRKSETEAEPAPIPVPQAHETPGRPEVAMVDDVIEALRSSELLRAVIVSAGKGEDTRPLSVDLARRLALRGRSVLLVDLSEEQNAARAMGLTPSVPGLMDLVRGDANFAEIARRDFATGADIVSAGRNAEGEGAAGRWSERRHALDFMERSYETLLIDAGEVDTSRLKSVIDTEAALLVSVEGCTAGELQTAVDQLASDGFADMILVRDRQAA